MLRQGKNVLPACSTGKESVIRYEAENRVLQERTILWWVWGSSSRKMGVEMRMWCRSLPCHTAEHRCSGLEFGIRVTRKGSRWKDSFSNASCWGLWNILTQSRAWIGAKDLSRNSKPCTKTILDLEQMKGTLREFKERPLAPWWLLAGYFERRLGHAFPHSFSHGSFQHRFSPLVYSRACGLGSLNTEIPAVVGTGLSQLEFAKAIILMMLMVIDWH